MRSLLIFLLLWLGLLNTAVARQYTFSPVADQLFTDSLYGEIIRSSTLKILLQKGGKEWHIAGAYAKHENEIRSKLMTSLPGRFLKLDKKYKKNILDPGSAEYKRQYKSYELEIQNGIQLILNTNADLTRSLLEKNEHDRILKFNSNIQIKQNGLIQVKEQITIYNGDDESSKNTIKRGIVREFPTTYRNTMGLISKVHFKVISVKLDQKEELYKLERLSNGNRMYIGRSDYFLSPGKYTYEITYETDRQIIFHNNKDEFYWNVNGTGWDFTADEVNCKVVFPAGAQIIEHQCYTGVQGSTEQACRSMVQSAREIEFRSSHPLKEYEGLTLAVSIKKGILIPIPQGERIMDLLKDNLMLTIAAVVVLILFIWLFAGWWRVGRDPDAGVVLPEFAPPAGMSPADVGYALHQTYSPQLFSAAIVDYIVQKQLNVDVEKEGLIFKTPVYTFSLPGGKDERDEIRYQWYGFDAGRLDGEKVSKGKYNTKVASMNTDLERQLKTRLLSDKKEKSTFKAIFSPNDHFKGMGVLILIVLVISSFIYVVINKPPLTYILILGGIVLTGMIIQTIFSKIMSAYTQEGRRIVNQIQGFKMYLETTEKHIFDQMNPPEENLQLFEKYLPYAIALGVENRWGERFKSILDEAIQQGYNPAYRNLSSSQHFSSSSLSSGFAAGFSSTIASASTPPSSSSGGSSGGGFSGGGGGGGGGGGW
ncbi:MAG: DUF2207 domain-containing protein [Chitinophagaceae bacterium]|nr:DUF2207 domain-containing protein [Chitinophagaceae bacterium]